MDRFLEVVPAGHPQLKCNHRQKESHLNPGFCQPADQLKLRVIPDKLLQAQVRLEQHALHRAE